MRETWPLTWHAAGWFVLSFVMLTGVFTGIGKLITGPLHGTFAQHDDESLAIWWVRQRTPSRDTWSLIGSQLAETMPKILVTTLVAVILLFVWHRWLEPLMLVLALILEASVFIVSTNLVGRPRPPVEQLERSPVGSSFPSGHVAAATTYGAAVVVVAWHTRKLWAPWVAGLLTALVVAAVGCARMYRGMHFLSDAIGGVLLGLAAVLVTKAILSRTPRGREALGTERR